MAIVKKPDIPLNIVKKEFEKIIACNKMLLFPAQVPRVESFRKLPLVPVSLLLIALVPRITITVNLADNENAADPAKTTLFDNPLPL